MSINQNNEILIPVPNSEKNGDLFKIIVIGDHLTGKSTFVNSLLGWNFLPVNRYTTVTQQLKYGEDKRAFLHFNNQISLMPTQDLPKKAIDHIRKYKLQPVPPLEISYNEITNYFIPQVGNSIEELINVNPYKKIELFWPIDLLKNKIEITDFHSLCLYSNRIIREQLINCLITADAIIFLMRSDRLLNDYDMNFISKTLMEIGFSKTLFAISCWDLVPESQQQKLKYFACNSLGYYTAFGSNGVFFVSALNALWGRNNGNQSVYYHSGIPEIEKALIYLWQRKNASFQSNTNKQNANSESIIVTENVLETVAPIDTPVSDYNEDEINDETKESETKIIETTKPEIEEDNLPEEDIDSYKTEITPTLENINDIGEYLRFAEEIINKYSWDSEVENDFKVQLEKIKIKHEDTKLNLSVVGEFSVGKSTFINALLRNNFLRSSMLQGTTVASTVIEYSPDYAITLHYKNRETEKLFYNSSDELSNNLNAFATTPDIAQNIDRITVHYPSENLYKGLRIIDTPGTNATELWHEETTVRAISELSDASIILIDPTQPLPESQQIFIEDNLNDVIEQCIFIITKIDLVKPAEREIILKYLKNKITSIFHIENPIIIPYSSLTVLESAINGETIDDDSEKNSLLKMSIQNESELYSCILNRKSITQTNKIAHLLENLYKCMSGNIDKISSAYKKEHEILERTQQTDLKTFVDQEKSQEIKTFAKNANTIRKRILNSVTSQISEYKENILSEFNSCSSVDDVNNFVKNTLTSLCDEYSQKIFEKSYDDEYMSIKGLYMDQINIFKNNFKNQYESLGLLPMEGSENNVAITTEIENNITLSPSGASKKLNNHMSKEDWFFGGGAIAGAVAGSMILPGIGTFLGGIIGAIGGIAAFGKTANSLKAKIKDNVFSAVNSYFSEIISMYENNINGLVSQMMLSIDSDIENHFNEYEDFVSKKIAEDKEQKKAISEKIRLTNIDIKKIDCFKIQLKYLEENLKKK